MTRARCPKNAWSVLLLAMALLVGVAWAQEPQVGVQSQRGQLRRELAPGIWMVDWSRSAPRGMERGQYVLLEGNALAGRLMLSKPKRGPWSAESLVDLATEAGTRAALSLRSEPALTEDPWAQGLIFEDGRLYSWPATGPILVVSAEGRAQLREAPSSLPGVAFLDDGTTIPLAGINGAPDAAKLALYRGSFDGSGRTSQLWPAETLFLRLRPDPRNTNPEASLWDERMDSEERLWSSSTPMPLSRASMSTGEWGLIVPPGIPPEVRTLLARTGTLRFHLPLEGDLGLSSIAVEIGPFVARDGDNLVPEGRTDPVTYRSLLGVDSSGRRVVLASFGSRERGTMTAELGAATQYVLDLGMTDVALVNNGEPRLLPDADSNEWRVDRHGARSRLALVPTSRAPRIAFGDDQEYEPVLVSAIDGTNQNATRNTPQRLMDGLAAPDDAVDTFWIGQVPLDGNITFPLDPEDRPYVDFLLAAPSKVAAIDLVHADACGFSPAFNLRAFRILGRNRAFDDWEVLFDVRHDAPVPIERLRLDTPKRLEALRLEVLEPNFLTDGRTARLAELTIWGAPALGQ